jgi:hypothetical protein
LAQPCLIDLADSEAVDRDPFAPNRYLGWGRRRIKSTLSMAGLAARSPHPCRVDYVPGRSITISWLADLSKGEGSALGAVVLHAAHRPLARIERVAEDEWGNPVYLFPAAADPVLSGLARALDPAPLAHLLAECGVLGSREPVPMLGRHEPMRRAVVAVSGAGEQVALEVVPPREIDELCGRHLLMAGELPVPRYFGRTHDGIVVLGDVPGRTLRSTLLDGELLPPWCEIEALLDRLPRALAHQDGAVGVLERVGTQVELIAAVSPEHASRLGLLAAALAPFASLDPGPLIAHHGALQPESIIVRAGRVEGLLDVGGVGEGYRIDDVATIIGHLKVLALAMASERCDQLAQTWLHEIERAGMHRPSALRARVAAVILGLASECFRQQDPDWPRGTRRRISLAERWLEQARQAERKDRGFIALSR